MHSCAGRTSAFMIDKWYYQDIISIRIMVDNLMKFRLTVLKYPPYSPDLSQYDFLIFGLLKKTLQVRCFYSDNEVRQCSKLIPISAKGLLWIRYLSLGKGKELDNCMFIFGDYVWKDFISFFCSHLIYPNNFICKTSP